ncbi:MAG: helix-turn-helix domain-containing protein [Nanoarchaeota archaeon]
MEKIKEFLMSLGVGKNESEVYAALTQYGTSSVLEISRKTNLHRSNIYDSLNELIRRGLIFKEEDSKAQKFTAREPETFMHYLKQKELELRELIKDYQNKTNLKKETATIMMTKGIFAIREILEDMLKTGRRIFVYGIPKETPDKVGPILNEFHKERVKKKIPMKHIYNSNSEDRVKWLSKLANTEARMLPAKFDSTATTIINGDKIYIVFWDKEPTVVQINGENAANPYKNYFEILWSRAKSVK